jgi:hypothetical protein
MHDELRREAEYLRQRAAEVIQQDAVELRDGRAERERQERLRLSRDYPVRRAKHDTQASLKSLLRATGYSPETLNTFVSVAAATHGKGGLEGCVNWRVGVYLDGGGDVEVESLEKLPDDPEARAHVESKKRIYAQKAKRAYRLVKEEERRTGYVLLVYQPGDKDRKTGKGISSKIDPLFIQYQVEIERREAAMRRQGITRGARFERAAREFVATLPCHPETEEQRAARLEREARARQEWHTRRAHADSREPARAAERKVKSCLKKVEQATGELTACGLASDELKRTTIEAIKLTAANTAAALSDPEERAAFIRQLIEQLSDALADTLPCDDETATDEDDDAPEYLLAVNERYSEQETEAVQEPEAAESSRPPTFSQTCENSNENDNSPPAQVFMGEYLRAPKTPAPLPLDAVATPDDLAAADPPASDPVELEERAAILEFIGGLTRAEAERRAFGQSVVPSGG